MVGPLAPSAMICQNRRTLGQNRIDLDLPPSQPAESRYLGFDPVGVALGELLLAGGWDQDVAVRLQDAPLVGDGVREAHDGTVGLETGSREGSVAAPLTGLCLQGAQTHHLVVLQLLGVHPLGVPDASVKLANADALRSEAVEVAHGVEPHVPEALQTAEGAMEAGSEPDQSKHYQQERS